MRRLIAHTGKRARTGEWNGPDRSSYRVQEGNRALGTTLCYTPLHPSIRRNRTSLHPGSLHFVELISSTTEQFVIAAHALLCSPVSSFSKPLSHYSLFLSPSLWVEARGKKVSSVCFKLLLRSESCVGRFGEHKHNAVLPN